MEFFCVTFTISTFYFQLLQKKISESEARKIHMPYKTSSTLATKQNGFGLDRAIDDKSVFLPNYY